MKCSPTMQQPIHLYSMQKHHQILLIATIAFQYVVGLRLGNFNLTTEPLDPRYKEQYMNNSSFFIGIKTIYAKKNCGYLDMFQFFYHLSMFGITFGLGVSIFRITNGQVVSCITNLTSSVVVRSCNWKQLLYCL